LWYLLTIVGFARALDLVSHGVYPASFFSVLSVGLWISTCCDTAGDLSLFVSVIHFSPWYSRTRRFNGFSSAASSWSRFSLVLFFFWSFPFVGLLMFTLTCSRLFAASSWSHFSQYFFRLVGLLMLTLTCLRLFAASSWSHFSFISGSLFQISFLRCYGSKRRSSSETVEERGNCTRRNTILETAANVKAYETTKQQSLREARIATLEGEKEIEEELNNIETNRNKSRRSQRRPKTQKSTQRQKLTELEKQKNFDKVLAEEKQVSKQSMDKKKAVEREAREKETQVLSLSSELNKSDVKVEKLERTKRQLQAECDELLEEANNSNNISKGSLLIDEKRRHEARATVKLEKQQKLKAERNRR
jgi:hypothetical protein